MIDDSAEEEEDSPDENGVENMLDEFRKRIDKEQPVPSDD